MMRELSYFRPSYVVQDDVCEDAHRVVRNALAVGGVLATVDSRAVIDAMSVVERAEALADEHSISSADAAKLADALERVATALLVGLDGDLRPRGSIGDEILEEARTAPDPDRVFEIMPDGRIGLMYPRISLVELVERLPEVAAFLRRAAERGCRIVLDED